MVSHSVPYTVKELKAESSNLPVIGTTKLDCLVVYFKNKQSWRFMGDMKFTTSVKEMPNGRLGMVANSKC